MRNLKLTVAYKGTHYVGWQVQPNGISVQQKLEEAWQASTQEQIRIVASGRTDSGVHALGQVCSVATATNLNCETLKRALNANTPDDISIISVQTAPTDFHAIRDASRKTYRYQVQHGRVRNPLVTDDHWFVRHHLKIDLVKDAAARLVGEMDFASFEATGSERTSTVRHLSRVDCISEHRESFQYMYFELTSNGFLYNMVRNIVGTLVHVGQGRESPEWIVEVLAKKDRKFAGPTAPAHGLLLVNVDYDGIEFGSD